MSRQSDRDRRAAARSPLELRVAGPDDVAAVVALVESAYRGEASRAGWTTEAELLDGQRTDVAEVRALLDREDCEILLAERDGELVGCCQLERRGAHGAYFGMFAVRPGLQGGGIGRWLIDEAERRAVGHCGAVTMRMAVLWPRSDLVAWYRRLGYEPTGERLAFPYGDERYGVPRRGDLAFVVLEKALRG